MEIKPIETEYGGYKFRSRLEARWAVFFDTAKIKYEYEPEGFELDDGTKYLPDFYLPEYDWYVEVKPPRKNAAEELKRATRFIGDKMKALLILGNIPPKKQIDLWHYRVGYYDVIDRELTFARVCAHANTEEQRLYFSNWLFVDNADRKCIEIALKWQLDKTLSAVHDLDIYCKDGFEYCKTLDTDAIELLSRCYDRARKARFEHGDKP